MSTTESATTSAGAARKKKWLLIAVIMVAGAMITGGIAALLINIFQHKQEGTQQPFRVVALDEKSFDPAVWGQNFPKQYETFKKTAEMPEEEKQFRTPTTLDPRAFLAKSKLTADPRLVTMWQGYAFAVEYNEPRGHEYMLLDQQLVKRVQDPFKQPGACLNCHASIPEVLNNIGGDPAAAWATMNKMPYADATKLAKHPVTCIDCHDPATMELRITRPAFIEGIKEYKASLGVKDYDVTTMATTQEMRSFVCAQCHVEYYFKGDAKTLTFPWDKGLTAQNAIDYYDEIGFTDFTQKLTGAKALKAQHPDFETWSQGVHARSGVSCADCHMPYKRDGATKMSDHQVASPMRSSETINSSCLTCHRTTETEMKDRVAQIHDRYEGGKNISFDALDALIKDIAAAQTNGTPADKVDIARSYQRRAQFFLDYVVSENSRGFHAPQYTMTLLNEVTDACRKGQLVLRGVDMPLSSTPKAQAPAPTPAPTPTK